MDVSRVIGVLRVMGITSNQFAYLLFWSLVLYLALLILGILGS
jgi:hypothetical protein